MSGAAVDGGCGYTNQQRLIKKKKTKAARGENEDLNLTKCEKREEKKKKKNNNRNPQ